VKQTFYYTHLVGHNSDFKNRQLFNSGVGKWIEWVTHSRDIYYYYQCWKHFI